MKQILIFAGTTEGRQLAELLASAGISCCACVATEYGKHIMTEQENLQILEGRMDEAKMQELMEREQFAAVVDATHPYAVAVSENIRQSAKAVGLPYLRLKRDTTPGDLLSKCGTAPGNLMSKCDTTPKCDAEQKTDANVAVCYVKSPEEAAELLKKMPGNVLLTTGSKDLAVYAGEEALKTRLFVRVLPGCESIRLCEEQGIIGKQIIAMQGPFSVELNEALLRHFQIGVMVTKESGRCGGFEEKIEAAERAQIPVVVIGNPDSTEGFSMEQTVEELSRIMGVPIRERSCRTIGDEFSHRIEDAGATGELHVTLVGIGMGNPHLLTKEAEEAIRDAAYLFGAKRLLESLPKELTRGARMQEKYLPADILPELAALVGKGARAAIVFSGDTGFYSGAKKMYAALQEFATNQSTQVTIKVCPGISTMSYLAARAGMNYEDAVIASIHGRSDHYVEKLAASGKIFLLVSGAKDMRDVGESLQKSGLTGISLVVGYQLSYDEEWIKTMTPEECMQIEKEGLYACFITADRRGETPEKGRDVLTPGLPDGAFIRDKVPMTKEEIREVSLCKLRLGDDAVLYDVGSGTGSIAVEAARLSDRITVYAIEKRELAQSLIRQNAEKHGVKNLRVVAGEAPEALLHLPVPSHAFIGGSSGNLAEILSCLYEKNSHMRVVLNAISLETVAQITELLKDYPLAEKEIIQMQVSRAKEVGAYHLMQAENPIYIVSFTFDEKGKI